MAPRSASMIRRRQSVRSGAANRSVVGIAVFSVVTFSVVTFSVATTSFVVVSLAASFVAGFGQASSIKANPTIASPVATLRIELPLCSLGGTAALDEMQSLQK